MCIFACCVHRLVPRVDFSQRACSVREGLLGGGEVEWVRGGLYVVVVGITCYHVLNPKSAFMVLTNFHIWIQII